MSLGVFRRFCTTIHGRSETQPGDLLEIEWEGITVEIEIPEGVCSGGTFNVEIEPEGPDPKAEPAPLPKPEPQPQPQLGLTPEPEPELKSLPATNSRIPSRVLRPRSLTASIVETGASEGKDHAIKAAFSMFDLDGSGEINFSELSKVAKSLGLNMAYLLQANCL